MSEKKVGKRLLTWVLVLVMTLSLLPLNVLADEIPLDEPTGEEAMIDERDNVMDVSLDGIAERKSSQNYATWWPVFWGFDKKSEVTTANLIKVTAGTGNTVLYASEQLSAKEALQAQTATVGNAVNNNFQVVADPGYYVSQYRIVCGNHYGCGVSPYNSSTPVNTDGNYTSAITVLAPAEKFTHNKINGIFSKYPQQAPDPNDEDLYDCSATRFLRNSLNIFDKKSSVSQKKFRAVRLHRPPRKSQASHAKGRLISEGTERHFPPLCGLLLVYLNYSSAELSSGSTASSASSAAASGSTHFVHP